MKITIHPLFVAFGVYYAAVGRIFEFLSFTVTALIHETGHSVVAAGLGYRLDKMVLMPFGAVAKGEIDGLKLKDEIKIALAGPFVNLAVGLFFTAIWWIFPEVYAFTDIAAFANYSMALVNLIPAYPLDGGRVLSAVLALKTNKKKARRICAATGIIFSAVLFFGFLCSFIKSPVTANYSLLFFCAFVLFGVFSHEKNNVYVKIFGGVTEAKLLRGMPVLRQAVSEKITVKKLMSILDADAVNEIEVFNGETRVAVLSQKDIDKIIQTGEIYSQITDFL